MRSYFRLGLILNLIGGLLYSYTKYREGFQARRINGQKIKRADSRDYYYDLNQNTKESRNSLATIESLVGDINCDRNNIGTTLSRSIIVSEKVRGLIYFRQIFVQPQIVLCYCT